MSLLIPLMSSSTPLSCSISSPDAAPTPPLFTPKPDSPASAPLVLPLPGLHRSPARQTPAPAVPKEVETGTPTAGVPPWRSFNTFPPPPPPPPPPQPPPRQSVGVSSCLKLQALPARHSAAVRQNLHAYGFAATAPDNGGIFSRGTWIAPRCRDCCLSVSGGTRLWGAKAALLGPPAAPAAFAAPAAVASAVVASPGFETILTSHSAAFVKPFVFDRIPAAFSFLFSRFSLSPFGSFVLVFFLEYDGLRYCRGR